MVSRILESRSAFVGHDVFHALYRFRLAVPFVLLYNTLFGHAHHLDAILLFPLLYTPIPSDAEAHSHG